MPQNASDKKYFALHSYKYFVQVRHVSTIQICLNWKKNTGIHVFLFHRNIAICIIAGDKSLFYKRKFNFVILLNSFNPLSFQIINKKMYAKVLNGPHHSQSVNCLWQ